MCAKESDPLNDVGQFEADLSLRKGFFRALLNEDDWSFVIKLHALVDSAITHMLVEELGRPELLRPLSRLSLADTRSGKLAFGRELGLLDGRDRLFVQKLSEIRNSFAHDVRMAGSTLADYARGLNDAGLASLVKAVGPGRDPFPVGTEDVPERQFVLENLKLTIWVTAMYTIALAYHQRKLAASRNALFRSVLALPSRLKKVDAQ